MIKKSGGFLCLIFSFMLSVAYAEASEDQPSKPIIDKRNRVESFLSTLTPEEESALQEKLKLQKRVDNNPFGLVLYEPSYVLPAYYTGSPDHEVYENNTPGDQGVRPIEFKAKISVLFPAYHCDEKLSLNVSYTQVSFWQTYVKSPYFRETDYEPQAFISYNFKKNWLFDVGINHQSNGRGGDMERSWNRVFSVISVSGERYLIALKPWIPVFQADSSDFHNKDIANYMGYGTELFVYKTRHQEVSVMFRNAVESGFSRGATIMTWSFPIKPNLRFYIEGFAGYGQSLIEYNHYTNSVGVGLALNDWI